MTNKFSEKNNLFFLIWYRNKEEFQEEDIERKEEEKENEKEESKNFITNISTGICVLKFKFNETSF